MKYDEFNPKAFGKTLKKLMNHTGYTASSLAQVVHTSERHIKNIMSGSAKPSLSLFIAIANALNVSADILLSDSIVHKGNRHDQVLDLLSTFDENEYNFFIDMIINFKKHIIGKKKEQSGQAHFSSPTPHS